MKKLVQIVCVFLLIISFQKLNGQDVQFSHYMFNNLFNNPAYSGVEGYTKLTAMHRTQWAGYAPTNGPVGGINSQLVSLTSPVMRYNSGFGFYVLNENIVNQLNYIQVQASGAYHLGIKESKISIGFRGGIITQNTNKDAYVYIDPDPEIENIQATQVRPDFSLGVNFQHKDFYVGAAFNHLIEAEFGFGADRNRNPYPKDLLLTAGYTFPINYDVNLTPSFLVRTTEFSSYTFDVSAVATYKEKIWGGLSFRQQEAAILMLGYSFLKENTLKFGYAFDYILVEQSAKSATSHEIMVSYRLPAISTSGKKVVRTPRFRH
ncbi:membrane protein [Marivirga tractuosa]|uniref:Membrane protein n=1 Tax=Marivirga tractuosa (strain ATCC 23168 / DSM 4126 / NBRC 15989 / NCIMB 1408 / VKM B-1430 / H-43) TaxID=643867 RepID=E4TNW9_MARTH|nr:type IX secretion system membrane protein PorP/SprF [Marivirga tractuosa]ADR22533.1 putative membrane protein [Marivirga tractuosa DSM 4126]BDD16796.1 membrane protein [Marivirga tractuosa]